MNLERAIEIAASAHANQKDKAGAPYILHPLRVMFKVESDIERMAAVMHDVVEDSEWTLERLREEGFPDEVLHLVDCLTHRDGESYDDFIERVCQHLPAVRVKLADIEDNLDIRRINELKSSDLTRIEKYHRARKRLKEIIGRT